MAQQSQRQRSRRQEPGIEQVIVEGLLKGVWALLSLPFRLAKGNQPRGKRGGITLARSQAQELAAHWPAIAAHLEHPQTYGLAVTEGDKLLDAAMQAAGVGGDTMGERLKACQAYFPAYLYQQIWDAHKLRNALAHEVGVRLQREQAANALQTFRNALLQFGVIV